MRRANILKFITNTSVAVGLGAVTLFGGIARADTYSERVQAELNRGKDYSAAFAEASRATGPLYASKLTPDASKALSAMNGGQDYSAAWEAASRATQTVFSPEQVAKAQKAEEEMNEGVDYAAAWEDTSNEQPAARVQEASRGGGASGHERSAK